MTGLVLRIILFLIVVRLIWKFARGVLEGAGYLQTPSRPSVGLARDPVCGVFVVPANALTLGSGLETRYFCSEKCRQEWRRR